MFNAQAFESALIHTLDQARLDLRAPRLAESMRYSLLAPGKRIRPKLAFAAAEAVGCDRASALSAALAIEMIHCFTLIHDDLPCMDDDDFRRGRPSNHKVFGEAVALLAGDSMIPLAFETLLTAPGSTPRALQRLAHAAGARGVCGGQAAELALPSAPEGASESEIERVHQGKTGELFECTILLPADLVSLSETSDEFGQLRAFARAFGQAFQAADDLEDALESAGARELATSLAASARGRERCRQSADRLKECCDSLTWAPTLAGLGEELRQRVLRNL